MWHGLISWFVSNGLVVLGLLLAAAGVYYAFVQVKLIRRQNAVEREAKARRPNLYISVLNQRAFVRGADVIFAEWTLQVSNSGDAEAHGFNWTLRLEPHMRDRVRIFREDETEVFPELSLFYGTDGYSPVFRDASLHYAFPDAYIPIGRMRIEATDGQLPSFMMFSHVKYNENKNKSWDKIILMNLGGSIYAIKNELASRDSQ